MEFILFITGFKTAKNLFPTFRNEKGSESLPSHCLVQDRSEENFSKTPGLFQSFLNHEHENKK